MTESSFANLTPKADSPSEWWMTTNPTSGALTYEILEENMRRANAFKWKSQFVIVSPMYYNLTMASLYLKRYVIEKLGIPESDIKRWVIDPTRDVFVIRLWNWRKLEVTGRELYSSLM